MPALLSIVNVALLLATESELLSLRERRNELERTVDRLAKELSVLTEEIHFLKQQNDEANTAFLVQYRLTRRLKEAQEVADRLSIAQRDLASTRRAIDRADEERAREMAPPADTFALVSPEWLRALRTPIALHLSVGELVDFRELVVGYRKEIERRLERLEQALALENRRERLKSRVSEFLEEVAFFEDETIIRSPRNSPEEKDEKEKNGATLPLDNPTSKPPGTAPKEVPAPTVPPVKPGSDPPPSPKPVETPPESVPDLDGKRNAPEFVPRRVQMFDSSLQERSIDGQKSARNQIEELRRELKQLMETRDRVVQKLAELDRAIGSAGERSKGQ